MSAEPVMPHIPTDPTVAPLSIDERLDLIEDRIHTLQETLNEILTKVDSVVDNVAPLVKQVEESSLFKMLGGPREKRKERRARME